MPRPDFRPDFRWIAAALSVAALSVVAAPLALAAPPLPHAVGPAPATEWYLERGTEDGLDYMAVTATNTGTDIALQLLCTVDGGVAVTLFGEAGAPSDPDETVVVTARVDGQPPRTNRWQQALEEGDVRTFDLDGRDAGRLVAELAGAAAGEVRFDVAENRPANRPASPYVFDLGTGMEERRLLGAACASWRSGSEL